MTYQIFKPCGLIALSIALLYSGVAWAMERCLRDAGHSNHAASEHRHNPQPSANHNDSQDPSARIIHCTSATHQTGPAALVASAKLSRFSEGVQLKASHRPEAISPEFKNTLWLEALFRKIITFSSPGNLARHLFLSVLQI